MPEEVIDPLCYGLYSVWSTIIVSDLRNNLCW